MRPAELSFLVLHDHTTRHTRTGTMKRYILLFFKKLKFKAANKLNFGKNISFLLLQHTINTASGQKRSNHYGE